MATGVVCRWQAEGVSVGDVVAWADRMRCQEVRTATRAAVVNLVVVAADADAAARARSAVAGLGAHHPGRIVIVVPLPEAPEGIDAEIELQETDLAERHLWWEVISLQVGGEAADHLGSVIEPLLLHDLPVAVWHAGRVPSPADLVTAGAHVLLDAPGDGSQPWGPRLAEVGRLLKIRHVTDLEWLAAEPWRRALAVLFDPPDRRALLSRAGPATVSAPGWRALLLGGWLADRLGLPPEDVDLVPESGATTVELVVGGRLVAVAAEGAGQVVARLDRGAQSVGGAPAAGLPELLSSALSRPATDPSYASALAGARGLLA